MKLCCREDGSFHILHFTDLHWTVGTPQDIRTARFLAQAIAAERPDLIVLTGDIFDKLLAADPARALLDVLAPITASGIPWAFAFGNHEHESPLPDCKILSIISSSPNSLNDENSYYYSIPIYASPEDTIPVNVIYMLDSGAKTQEPFGGSAWFDEEQMEWYQAESDTYTRINGGAPIPSVAFFHIPLPEYREVWYTHVCYGEKRSSISSPKINVGMFSRIYLQRDIRWIFVGHNSMNDFYGKLHGVCLGYTRTGGYTKGEEGFPRGGRVIRLKKDHMDTWQRLDDGSVYRPEKHLPCPAEMECFLE